MSLDDDTTWLDALAGRIGMAPSTGEAAAASRALVREAVALRELSAVLSWLGIESPEAM